MSTVDSISYGTRKRECYRIYDNELGFVDRTTVNVKFLKKKWQKIENFEYSKRKNGKVLSKLILMFPNEWTQQQKEGFIQHFLESKFGKKHNFTFCFHRGKDGEVIENSHGHLYYSERILTDSTYRKDPTMSKLGYVKKFVKDWQKGCGIDLSKSPKVKRIPMKEWKANPVEARLFKVKIKNIIFRERKEINKTEKKLKIVEMLLVRTKHNYQRKSSKAEHKITKDILSFFPTDFLMRFNKYKKENKKKIIEPQNFNIEKRQRFIDYVSTVIRKDHIIYFHHLQNELQSADIQVKINLNGMFEFLLAGSNLLIYEIELPAHIEDLLQDFKKEAFNNRNLGI